MDRSPALPALLALAVALGLAPAIAAGGIGQNMRAAGIRQHIAAVGSSTVYPFTTIAAERYLAASPDARAPVIEATGTGAGMKLFCAGLGPGHPDIENASRRMKQAEYAGCAANGVRDVVEVQIGIDGVAFAEALDGPRMTLTPAIVYRALAYAPGGRPNAARTWRDVDAALPAVPIRVYGPPSTSGTRDALAELILAAGCEATDAAAVRMKAVAHAAYEARCLRVREDGAYVDAGENDNLIVQKLQSNPQALGIFGYSYLEENAGAVRGVAMAGIMPSYATIADGTYPGARPLYLYVKKAHLDAVPGLRRYLAGYAGLIGPDGPLARRGLIPAPAAIRTRSAEIVRREMPLDPRALR